MSQREVVINVTKSLTVSSITNGNSVARKSVEIYEHEEKEGGRHTEDLKKLTSRVFVLTTILCTRSNFLNRVINL